MKYLSFLLTTLGVLFGFAVNAQTKTVPLNDGANLKIYQLEPESKSGNQVNAKVAISYNKGNEDPVFGMMWISATSVEDGSQIQLQNINVTDIKIPQLNDETEAALKADLTAKSDKINFTLTKSQFDNALQLYQKENALSKNIQHNAPKIIYAQKPSILILVDGTPNYQKNEELGVNMVVNSPFAIVQNTDGKHYVYGGKHWYVANSLKGNYALTTNLPPKISQVESSLKKIQEDNNSQEFEEYDENTIYDIIVSTEPAELIQSNGEANFSPVTGTNLLFVENSDDDIFMDINSQQYYTLLAGRWYTSNNLNNSWKYIASESLPKDFAQIIEGSSKDNVLASVAGTNAAKEAVLDAQIPQTAKISRSSSNTNISYDGQPQFESIDGTNMQYAVNSPASVIKYQGRFYAVEDGVWYVSNSAQGPWQVATDRPDQVALIPPSSPVYNVKYVYIYDVTPDYVYMGYTPGYLNTYIYGPTVVYGTGYFYRPWIGNHYYARPYTWGFNIRYNPWYGYGFGFNYYSGWFYNPWRWNNCGWWGPRMYRPSYVYRPHYFRGQMVRTGFYSNRYYNNYRPQITRGIRNNNIYRDRRDIVSRDRGRIIQPERNNGQITRPPRNIERNSARFQNPNAGERVVRNNPSNGGRIDRSNRNEGTANNGGQRIDRSYRNNGNSREGVTNGGQAIDRSYRNNNSTRNNNINNRGNVTQNRNNGINREYRNNNAGGNAGAPQAGSDRTFRSNDRTQRPNNGQRPQISENRTPERSYRGEVNRPNNNTRVTPNNNGRNNTPPQRNSGSVSRPQQQAPNRSSGSVQRGSSAPSRQSGASVQRSSERPSRSSGSSVSRGSSSQSSRSSGSVSRGSSSQSSRSSGGAPSRSSSNSNGRP
ncbi:hypothetical protein [Gynurincola endophyticus]|uniref:hypothetical protein n=1 Tax=Gynurincola endophyticus TaxID=2479004 RepID=UPI000F8E9FC9|nr:hypothetical protein [Gynurincola endophyticus]